MKRLTGVNAVLSTTELAGDGMRRFVRGFGAMIYTPFAPGEGNGECRGELKAANAAIAADYWDSRPSREGQFVQLLRTRFPRAGSTT